MSIGATFALIWVASTVAFCLAAIPIVVWAIKSRQFSDQDRARYLPLRNGCPVPPKAARRENDDA
ncbi:MAG: hypothetical protein QG656_1623 [Candidatus Hydrogenedentes bacterium]|nr:hypothetical protein [Candidatus Hydrogenedentota bacterium]